MLYIDPDSITAGGITALVLAGKDDRMNGMRFHRGFTIIEILTTVSIIAVLSAVVVIAASGVRARNNDATVKGHLKTIQIKAEAWYYAHLNRYNVSSSVNLLSGTCSRTATALKSPTTAPNVGMRNTVLGCVSGACLEGSPDRAIHEILQKAFVASDRSRDAVCVVSGTAYAVAFPLSVGSKVWCIDSTGVSRDANAGGKSYDSVTDADPAGKTPALVTDQSLVCN